LSEQDKQERERSINNTSYKHGQAIETDFLWSESKKQERESGSRNREQRRKIERGRVSLERAGLTRERENHQQYLLKT
jgi:hypothetical protein